MIPRILMVQLKKAKSTLESNLAGNQYATSNDRNPFYCGQKEKNLQILMIFITKFVYVQPLPYHHMKNEDRAFYKWENYVCPSYTKQEKI